jgi:hypothetical protein
MAASCKYQSDFTKCDYPLWKKDDSHCIFHSELIEEKKEKFKPQFEKHLEKLEKEPNKVRYIEGFIFPETLEIRDGRRFSAMYFYRCKFVENLEIYNCELESDFTMRNCTVGGDVSIVWSKFKNSFLFISNTVSGKLQFHANSVRAYATFNESRITDCILFRWSYFTGFVEIIDMTTNKAWYIYGVDFSSALRARFRNIDFSNVYLFDSKLVDVDFISTNWKSDNNRYVIGDEIVFRNNEVPEYYPVQNLEVLKETESIVESLYLQLCANYDRRRLFEMSGKFYISAMEMRRRARGNWLNRNLISWEAWYKYISNYGQSSNRAFWGIILMLVVCSVIISFDPHLNQINDTAPPAGLFQNISASINSFLTAFKYNLYYLIRPVGMTFESKISLTAFVTAWERIIVLVLGTFFLLALRRRFRRN